MEVHVEKTGPCEALVTLSVPREAFDQSARRNLLRAGKGVRRKGFRAGKVPLALLQRQFGQRARLETIEQFIHLALQQAVQEHELDTIGHQHVAAEEIELAEGADFSHRFEVSLRPKIELSQYAGLEIESELEPVMEQEVEAALEDLRRQRSRPVDAGQEGLPEDGMAVCKLTWTCAGETILERDGMRLSPLDDLPGVDPAAYKKAMLGARKGDEVELDLTIPQDFERQDLRGAQGRCKLALGEAWRMLPPTDAELCELFEVEDQDALLAKARENLIAAKARNEEQRIEAALLERVLASHADMDLPRRMVESQVAGRIETLRQQLASGGASQEDIAAEVARRQEELRSATEKGMKAFFLVREIAEKEDVRISEEDLAAELREIAARNRASFEEVRDYYRDNGLIDQVAVELMERRIRRLLRESAVITRPR